MTTALLEDKTRDEVWSGSIIDADVHANIPDFWALRPYMSDMWIDWRVGSIRKVYRPLGE
jgi:uncharacterized protein